MPSLDDDTLGRAVAERLQRDDVTTTRFDPHALWQDGRRHQRRTRFLLAGSGTGVCAITIGAVAAGLLLSGSDVDSPPPTAAPATASPSLSAPAVPSGQPLSPRFGPFRLTSLPAGYVITGRRDPVTQVSGSPPPSGLPTTSVLALTRPGAPILSVQCSVGATFELFTTPLRTFESRIDVDGHPGLLMDSGPGSYNLQWTPTPTSLVLVSITGATSRAAATSTLLDLATRISPAG